MSLFERFNPFNKIKPESKEIKQDDGTLSQAEKMGIEREYGHDELVGDLNENLRIKEIISGEDPMEARPEDKEAVENLLVRSAEDREIIHDNISLLKNQIEETKEKIRQYKLSIEKTEEEMIKNPTLSKTLEGLKRMSNSYENNIKEIEAQIKQEEQKLREFYNLN
ncbi:MAG: hypothetical protein QG580_336 [Patescibacteria group bacterium]|jgi:hypothetical protein|nr:hypothetical protein [Patescibacteria group bacterium]